MTFTTKYTLCLSAVLPLRQVIMTIQPNICLWNSACLTPFCFVHDGFLLSQLTVSLFWRRKIYQPYIMTKQAIVWNRTMVFYSAGTHVRITSFINLTYERQYVSTVCPHHPYSYYTQVHFLQNRLFSPAGSFGIKYNLLRNFFKIGLILKSLSCLGLVFRLKKLLPFVATHHAWHCQIAKHVIQVTSCWRQLYNWHQKSDANEVIDVVLLHV